MNPSRNSWLAAMCLIGVCAVIVSWAHLQESANEASVRTTVADGSAPVFLTQRVDSRALSNGLRINSKVISGWQPTSEAAFHELQSLGIKTVISSAGKLAI